MNPRRLLPWTRGRLGLGSLLDHLIPAHANSPAYVLGGTVVVLSLVQGVTGILLQQFYHPVPDENAAYNSVQFIVSIPLWSFVRNLHYWGAQFLIVLVLLHMVRVYVSAAYKRPRELLWLSGVALLVTLWLLTFTGSVLKWDQEGVEALGHNLELAAVAGPLSYWFSPSFAADVPLLIRVNSAHVSLLPIIAVLVVGLHVYLIRVLGISSPKTEATPREKMVPFSTHIWRMLLYGTLAFVFTIIVSLIIPAPLTSIGNPSIEISKPDWYLLWMYTVENYLGLRAIPYVLTPALALMLLVPALDRTLETDPRKRQMMMVLLIVALLLFAGLMINGALIAPQAHLE